MDRRSVVAVVLGGISVACATGVFESEPSPPVAVFEQLEEGEGSKIVGVVRDVRTGHALPKALVILQCTCLEGVREILSNEGGAFGFGELPPGKYTVQVLYKNANVSRTFELGPGMRMRVNFSVDPEYRFMITITRNFELAPGFGMHDVVIAPRGRLS